MVNGASISNHQAAAHVNNGEVTFFSTSFGTEQHLAKRDLAVSAPEATVDFAKASATASAQLGIPVYSEFEHALEYVAQPDGKAVNFANKASYKAIPLPRRDPTEGFSTQEEPGTAANIAAAAVNLFYLANVMHDISYQYGFTESAGNFQKRQLWQGEVWASMLWEVYWSLVPSTDFRQICMTPDQSAGNIVAMQIIMVE
ncbi:hypothetical protein BASA62_001979 [Batrachochytrium salamandrivorans]|nr:hypothetical protein BASA62_001979 [Batrachochytrium salamandrivorans]